MIVEGSEDSEVSWQVYGNHFLDVRGIISKKEKQSLNNNSFVRTLTVFADLYNFLTAWCSSALTVHTELCSLVLTVNYCKTEKLLTAVQSCSRFRGTAKFTVKFNLMRVTYLRCSIWNCILIRNEIDLLCSQFLYSNLGLTLLCSQFSFSNY